MIRRRWRQRVAPLHQHEDEYVQRRYEDASPRISEDIKRGRGLYSSYVPWIQLKLVTFILDERKREKQWLEQVPLYLSKRAWASNEEMTAIRTRESTDDNNDVYNNDNNRGTSRSRERRQSSSICNLL